MSSYATLGEPRVDVTPLQLHSQADGLSFQSLSQAEESKCTDQTRATPNSAAVKTVYWIRHAESEYNAIMRRPATWLRCRCCCDPMIYDPPLSMNGEEQTRRLRQHILALGLQTEVQHVFSSPLTRSLQTAVGAFGGDVPILVEHKVREVLDTCGDIGRPPLELQAEFPDLSFAHLDEHWWHYGTKGGPMVPVAEPRRVLQTRSTQFLAQLWARQESVLAVVAHSAFIKHTLGHSTKLPNCGIAKTTLRILHNSLTLESTT